MSKLIVNWGPADADGEGNFRIDLADFPQIDDAPDPLEIKKFIEQISSTALGLQFILVLDVDSTTPFGYGSDDPQHTVTLHQDTTTFLGLPAIYAHYGL